MFVKEYIDKVQAIVHASALSPFLLLCPSDHGEYYPGGARVYFSFDFRIGHESVEIRYNLKPNRDEQDSKQEEGRRIIKTPFEVGEVGVKWNTLKTRTVEEATVAANLYTEAVKLAGQISTFTESVHTIYDHYINYDAPPEPSRDDRWATCDLCKNVLPHSDKKDLVKACEERGLPKSGTKFELRSRLLKYAQEHGDPTKVEVYEEWLRDHIEPVEQ